MTNCFDIHLPISRLSVADQNALRSRAQALFAEQKFRPPFAKSAELQAIKEAIKGHVDAVAEHPMIKAAAKVAAKSNTQAKPQGMTVHAVKETLVRQLGAPIQKWFDTGRAEVVQSWLAVRDSIEKRPMSMVGWIRRVQCSGIDGTVKRIIRNVI